MPAETLIEGFAPSDQQRALWDLRKNFKESLHPIRAIYRMANGIDPEHFRERVRQLVERHEILRTSLVTGPNDKPVQIIMDGAEDCAVVAQANSAVRIDCLAAQSDKPFCATLLESRPSGEWYLLLEASPLNADLQSLDRIAEQITGVDGDENILQYADYAAWQVEVAAVRPALPVTTLPGLKLPFEKSAAQSAPRHATTVIAISTVSASEESWFAAWVAYLSRLCQSNQLAVARVDAGRESDELESSVGPYARLRYVACDVDEKVSGAELTDALLNAGEATGAMFGFEFASRPHVDRIEYRGLLESVALLTASLRINGQQIELVFDTQRLEASCAERMLEGFKVFSEAFLRQPSEVISKLPMVGEAERALLLSNFHGPRIPLAQATGVDQWVAEAVARNPETIAVQCGGVQITYRELDQKSNQLAHLLKSKGVGPNKLVGLAARRSVEAIIGIVGILKAGGAYVPLDPSYPIGRLETMISEAALEWIVMQPSALTVAGSAELIPLDFQNAALADQPTTLPPAATDPERLAYLIFTSGSTGKPKGVMLSHRALLQSTNARLKTYPGRVANYLLVSSFSFDSSVAGIFWTLSDAGTLTLPAEGMHQDPDELARLIEHEQISHFLALPSLYNAALERTKETRSLRVVIVAGEACPPELVARHIRVAPQAALYNEYGPTEAAVWSTVFRCDTQRPGKTVPIGNAIPNWQIFVTDTGTNLSPIGVPGELLVGGPGLANGYLNHPELTDSKFIRNPFTPEYSPRLYRTGDLVRLLPDGNLEFLGRIDHQVKIRGFRIELEEIENALKAQREVQDAIVIARDDTSGGKQLVGYLCRNGVPIDVQSVRSALLQRMPDYMVPSAFVVLERFPLNPNGKVDRNALPAPERARVTTTPAGELTDTERKLCGMIAEVLKLKDVGVTDDFFELGGHSLLAMQLISKIRDTFSADVQLRVIFDTPTARALADAVEKSRKPGAGNGSAIKRVKRGGQVELANNPLAKPSPSAANATRLPV